MVIKLKDMCDVRDGTHDSPTYVVDGYPLVTSKKLVIFHKKITIKSMKDLMLMMVILSCQ